MTGRGLAIILRTVTFSAYLTHSPSLGLHAAYFPSSFLPSGSHFNMRVDMENSEEVLEVPAATKIHVPVRGTNPGETVVSPMFLSVSVLGIRLSLDIIFRHATHH